MNLDLLTVRVGELDPGLSIIGDHGRRESGSAEPLGLELAEELAGGGAL